jgi:hypothetical protein
MPSTAQQTLLTAFNQASGRPAGGESDSQSGTLNENLIVALGQATQVIDAQTQATAANTEALAAGSKSQGSSAGKDASDALNAVSGVLGGGLSAMPLVSLFTSLFSAGSSEQAAPLVPFSLPPSLNLQSTANGQDVSWGENGLPRSVASPGSGAGQQITVQVQAMDSQSFLDHSDDIAQAVKQAMLNMNSINDVVSSL